MSKTPPGLVNLKIFDDSTEFTRLSYVFFVTRDPRGSGEWFGRSFYSGVHSWVESECSDSPVYAPPLFETRGCQWNKIGSL